MTRDELIEELYNCTGPAEAMQHIDRYAEDECERIARAIEADLAAMPNPNEYYRLGIQHAVSIARAEAVSGE